ncbi:hypothetical protein [Luteibacter sp. UNCMF331Sha3.1]|uniref:hypothetical protein n=1 Tax=Luteibacter sp. UNCMF331Sha3.1 TaxID=1502760 RepID=UPI0011138CD4|nr:hypothetical protein [Luteibacter sp. UNCMF331Sha3.1]
MQRVSFANVSYWDRVPVPHVRCFVCHPENDDFDPEEGCRPSQLRRVHSCPYVENDRGYEAYLRHALELATKARREDERNAPPGGYLVEPECHPRATCATELHRSRNATPEDEDMKLREAGMAAAMAVSVSSAWAVDVVEPRAPVSAATVVSPAKVDDEPNPVWPDNGIAQRELGDDGWLESLFVEHVDGKWIAWAIMVPPHAQAKAINFFTGEVIDVTVKMQLTYTGSFIDANGVKHEETLHSGFHYKDPRPGGILGNIRFAHRSVDRPENMSFGPIWFDTYQRMSDDDASVIWSKVPLYESNNFGRKGWDTLFGTALDLNDGTMLVSAGKYIFRLHQDDFTPVGSAPALHIVDESELLRALDEAKGQAIEDGDAWLTDKLKLK